MCSYSGFSQRFLPEAHVTKLNNQYHAIGYVHVL